MGTAHTPGPWKAFNMVHGEHKRPMTPEEIGEYVTNSVRKSIEDGGSADRFLFISGPGEDAPDICHVGNGPRGPVNAALIASAPELLAVTRKYLHQHGGDDLDCPCECATCADARAAIAKAEGR